MFYQKHFVLLCTMWMLFTSIIIFIGPFYLSISVLELYHPQQASTLPGGVFKKPLKKHADVKKKRKK